MEGLLWLGKMSSGDEERGKRALKGTLCLVLFVMSIVKR